MTIRFKSAPLENGNPLADEIREHVVSVSGFELYVTCAWTGLSVFLLAGLFATCACVLTRKLGYNLFFEGEERILPPIVGFVLGLVTFFSAINTELDLQMKLQVVKDRNGDLRPYRVYGRKRITSKAQRVQTHQSSIA
jgi:hypothetical protein